MSLQPWQKDRLIKVLTPYIRHGSCVLSSGRPSQTFVDVTRAMLCEGELIGLVGAMFWSLVHSLQVDAVGGPAVGAVPLVTALVQYAFRQGYPLHGFYTKPEGAGDRLHALYGCDLNSVRRVLVLDDVITTGRSTARSIDCVCRHGATPLAVACVVDRSGGALESHRNWPAQMVSLVSLEELVAASGQPGPA